MRLVQVTEQEELLRVRAAPDQLAAHRVELVESDPARVSPRATTEHTCDQPLDSTVLRTGTASGTGHSASQR